MKKHLFIYCLFLFSSCVFSINDEQEYLSWLNQDKHGVCLEKRVGDLMLKVKHLPPDFLAWKDLSDTRFTIKQRDSLVDFYNHSLTFMLTISPDSTKGAKDDILYRDVYNESDFKVKVNKMNFAIGQMIELDVDGKRYYPALAVMENTYGSTIHKNFIIVFSSDDKNKMGDWIEADFIFTDELFDTGINHFKFLNADFKSIPHFDFKSKKILKQ